MAAGMAASCAGIRSLPVAAIARLNAVNDLPIEALALDLVTLRHAAAMSQGPLP
jgi:hypothetical protein